MQLAYGTVRRVRTLDHAIETLGRRPRAQARPARAGRAATRRVPARASWTACRRTRPSTSRSSSSAAPGSSAPLRSPTRSCAGSADGPPRPARRASGGDAAGSRAQALLPGLGGGDVVAELGRRGALALMRGAERAAADGRARQPPAPPACLEPGPLERRPRRPTEWLERGLVWPQSRGSQLAGLGRRRRGPGSACSTSAPRPAGRRHSSRRRRPRSWPSRSTPAARESSRRTRRRLGATNVRVVGRATRSSSRRSSRASTACWSTRPARGSASLASRPDLRWRAEPLPGLQLALLRAALERVRPGGTVTYSVCTISARRERGRRGRRRRSRSTTSAPSSRASGTPAGRSACSPSRTSTARPGSSSRGCALSPYDPTVSWRDWIGAAEVEPSLYAADFAGSATR